MISAEAQVGSRADAFAQLVDRQLNDAFRLAGYILGNTPDVRLDRSRRDVAEARHGIGHVHAAGQRDVVHLDRGYHRHRVDRQALTYERLRPTPPFME